MVHYLNTLLVINLITYHIHKNLQYISPKANIESTSFTKNTMHQEISLVHTTLGTICGKPGKGSRKYSQTCLQIPLTDQKKKWSLRTGGLLTYVNYWGKCALEGLKELSLNAGDI